MADVSRTKVAARADFCRLRRGVARLAVEPANILL
jgi:hypothetical protein